MNLKHKQRGFILDPYRFGSATEEDPVQLMIHGTRLNEETIADYSTYARTLTTVGTAAISSTQYKFHDTSLYTNGTAGYITVPLNLGSGDFTVEFWVYYTSVSSSEYAMRVMQLGDGADAIDGFGLEQMHWNNDTYSWVLRQGYYNLTTITPISINTWQHVAVTKTNAGLTIFLDGIQGGTITNSVSFNIPKTLYIGTSNGSWVQNGTNYFDDIRVTKGVALYTNNFTPPPVALDDTIYDPYWWDNVSLLLDMENAVSSTTFVDNSSYNRTVTQPSGVVSHNAAGKKFGNTGGYFTHPNSNPYLQVAAATELVMGTGDFTAEGYVYLTSYTNQTPGAVTVLMGQDDGSTPGRWFIGIDTAIGSNTNCLVLYYNGASVLLGTTAVVTNQWHHIAISRNSGTIRLLLNGNIVATTTTVYDFSANVGFRVGGSTGSAQSIAGYMDSIRVTKGIGRYTVKFPILTKKFPPGLVICMDPGDYQSYVGTGNQLKDTSGYTRVGSMTDMTYSTSNGGNFSFNGTTSNWITTPTAGRMLTANFTMEVWCSPNATRVIDTENNTGITSLVTGGARFTINATHGGVGTTHANAGISVGTNGVSVHEHAGSYAPAILVYNTTLSNTTFTHILVSYSNGRPSLYINGSFVRQGLQSLKVVHCPIDTFGYGDYGNWFIGKAGLVRVYPRTFTAGDVTRVFNATRGRYGV